MMLMTDLTERQRGAIKLAAVTHGVSTHGGTVKALIKKGLAQDAEAAFGGGTTVRLTFDGLLAAEELIWAELEDRRANGHATELREREYQDLQARIQERIRRGSEWPS